MPEKSRILQQKLDDFTKRKVGFETELQNAVSELEKLQGLVMIGKANLDSLTNQQVKVNTINQTIARIEFEIGEIEKEIISEQWFEKRRRVIREVLKLDQDAEQAGNRFIKLYSDVENLSFSRFLELSKLRSEIVFLKQEFYKLVMSLFPSVQMLLSHDRPELQAQIDEFLAELTANGCILRVLRCTNFNFRDYATDNFNSSFLPENPLSDWIWLSVDRIESFKKKNGSNSPW